MRSLARHIVLLLIAVVTPQARAGGPLEITPSGMTQCLEHMPCVRLSIKNTGASRVSFGTDGFFRPEIHQPGIQYFSSNGTAWTEFGQVIGTFMAPRRLTTIEPGETRRLYVPISDIPSGAKAVRVSIQDKSGAFHESPPFDLAGKAISAVK